MTRTLLRVLVCGMPPRCKARCATRGPFHPAYADAMRMPRTVRCRRPAGHTGKHVADVESPVTGPLGSITWGRA